MVAAKGQIWVVTLTLISFLSVSALSETMGSSNLGRISIARVYSSSAHSSAQNLFDGINKSSWVSTDNNPWVRVTFTKPVTVQSITIHSADTASAPTYYELMLRHPDRSQFLTYPLVKTQTPVSKYVLPHPVRYIDEVWLSLLGSAPVRIDDIEILGEPASGVDMAVTVPSLDPTGPAFVEELQQIERSAIRRDFEKF